MFNGKGWIIRVIQFGKLKKLQITRRIDSGLKMKNHHKLILTSIEFLQENSLYIQTLIKKISLFNLRKKIIFSLSL